MTTVYPPITPELIGSIEKMALIAANTPDWLDAKACPYDSATREVLHKAFDEKTVEVVVEKEVPAKAPEARGRGRPRKEVVVVDEVAAEIKDIKDELKLLKLDAKALQTADKINIIKTRAALVEKMLVMGERAHNVKKLSHFQTVVMGILDDLMADEQRQEFLKRLEPFVGTE